MQDANMLLLGQEMNPFEVRDVELDTRSFANTWPRVIRASPPERSYQSVGLSRRQGKRVRSFETDALCVCIVVRSTSVFEVYPPPPMQAFFEEIFLGCCLAKSLYLCVDLRFPLMKSKAIAKLVCEQVLFWLMLLHPRMGLRIASTSGVTLVYRIVMVLVQLVTCKSCRMLDFSSIFSL